MKKVFLLGFVSITLLAVTTANAQKMEKGWHTGPYILGSVGVMNFDEDTDVFNNTNFGNKYPIAWGFLLGYNWNDFAAVEFQGRYVSDKSNGRSEDFGSMLLNFKYSIISQY